MQCLPKALHPELNLVTMPNVYASKAHKPSDTPTFNVAFIRSVRSKSSNRSDTIIQPPASAPLSMFQQMLHNRKVNAILEKAEAKPTLGPCLLAAPKSLAATSPSVTPLRKALDICKDSLADTITPKARTAKKSLRARPALGDLTNTPLRPTPLKKDTLTEEPSIVKVSISLGSCVSLPCMTLLSNAAVCRYW